MEGLTGIWDNAVAKVTGWFSTFLVMLPNLAAALAILLVALVFGRWVERVVASVLLRITGNRPISGMLATLARIALVLTALFFALGMLDLDKTVTSLLAGVGVVGLALGFAFQDIAANFMSGFLLTIQRPFDVGDLVEISGRQGRIRAVELRATELETLDGLSVLVPNKDVFQNAIVNYTKTPSRRVDFTVGTAYADDMERVRAVVRSALQGLPHQDGEREVEVFFEGFGDSSIDFVVRVWLVASDQRSYLEARSEALIAIKKAFDREKITIPFPIRTLDFGAKVVGGERLDAMALRVARGADPS